MSGVVTRFGSSSVKTFRHLHVMDNATISHPNFLQKSYLPLREGVFSTRTEPQIRLFEFRVLHLITGKNDRDVICDHKTHENSETVCTNKSLSIMETPPDVLFKEKVQQSAMYNEM